VPSWQQIATLLVRLRHAGIVKVVRPGSGNTENRITGQFVKHRYHITADIFEKSG
jgi:hypothetical protein